MSSHDVTMSYDVPPWRHNVTSCHAMTSQYFMTWCVICVRRPFGQNTDKEGTSASALWRFHSQCHWSAMTLEFIKMMHARCNVWPQISHNVKFSWWTYAGMKKSVGQASSKYTTSIHVSPGFVLKWNALSVHVWVLSRGYCRGPSWTSLFYSVWVSVRER